MALTRAKIKEILSKANIDEDKMDKAVEELLGGHTATVNALKEERDNYKAEAEKLPNVEKELNDLKKQAEKDGENPFEAKYEAEHKAFEQYKSKVEADNTKRAKTKAYKAMLKEANIGENYVDTLVKVADFDNIKIDKDGNIEGKDELINSVKTEYSAFVVETEQKGADTANPPAQNNGVDYDKMSDEDYYKVTYADKKGKE